MQPVISDLSLRVGDVLAGSQKHVRNQSVQNPKPPALEGKVGTGEQHLRMGC